MLKNLTTIDNHEHWAAHKFFGIDFVAAKLFKINMPTSSIFVCDYFHLQTPNIDKVTPFSIIANFMLKIMSHNFQKARQNIFYPTNRRQRQRQRQWDTLSNWHQQHNP